MNELPSLRTERLVLRIAGPGDADKCVAFNSENREFLAPWEPPMLPSSFDLEAQWTARQRAVDASLAGTGYSFAMCPADLEAERAPIIGWVNFSNVVRQVFQACYLGYRLDRRMQGHGLMNEALRAGIDYMFNTQRLHRIMANYMPHNQKSANVLRRLGFTVEGSAKSYLFIAGQWRDHVLTSLVNPFSSPPPGYDTGEA